MILVKVARSGKSRTFTLPAVAKIRGLGRAQERVQRALDRARGAKRCERLADRLCKLEQVRQHLESTVETVL